MSDFLEISFEHNSEKAPSRVTTNNYNKILRKDHDNKINKFQIKHTRFSRRNRKISTGVKRQKFKRRRVRGQYTTRVRLISINTPKGFRDRPGVVVAKEETSSAAGHLCTKRAGARNFNAEHRHGESRKLRVTPLLIYIYIQLVLHAASIYGSRIAACLRIIKLSDKSHVRVLKFHIVRI